VEHAVTALGVSERRACHAVGQVRSSQWRRPTGRGDEEPLTEAIVSYAGDYGRYGYRRITALLRADGWPVNVKRVHRIWRREGLKVPRRQPRRRRLWLNDGSCLRLRPCWPRHVWAYDFVFDRCANGQQLKCLTVVDEFTHECLAIDVAGSIRSGRVIEVLSRLVSVHGSPKHLRSDNGPEFVSRAVLKWLTALSIDTAHIDPGKPWQNGTNESFNGKFRDECLSMEWFRNRIDAKITIEQFRRQYNEIRPHSSLGQLTPVEYKQKLSSTNYPEQAIS